MLLLVIRRFWMTSQLKAAFRKAMGSTSIAKLKIRRITVFRDCGSFREAFISSLSIRDYHVQWQKLDGDERISNVSANFHPGSGRLRSLTFPPTHCPQTAS
jgi:hypothetical protein